MSSPLTPRGRGAYPAFTLIELLTVIAIIGILAGIVFGATRGVSTQGRIARAEAELGALSTALESYHQQFGDYPNTATTETNPQGINPASFTAQPGDRAYNLFRALNGARGPRLTPVERQINKAGTRLAKYAKAFVNPASFSLEREKSSEAPVGQEPLPNPAKDATTPDPDFANAFLDPWGNRYLYVYRTTTSPNLWRASGYVLYSAGPDGLSTFPSAAGALPDPALPENADNIYAKP